MELALYLLQGFALIGLMFTGLMVGALISLIVAFSPFAIIG